MKVCKKKNQSSKAFLEILAIFSIKKYLRKYNITYL